ncbi:MAG: hypothetical protein ACYCTV_11220 [Leptospirales bacterium]
MSNLMHRQDREGLQKEELPGLCVLERERSLRKIVLVEIRPEYCLKQDKSFLEKSTGPFPENGLFQRLRKVVSFSGNT